MDVRILEEFVARTRGATRTAAADQAASEVLAAFAPAAVESLLLKGPALRRLLYRTGESRSYLDVDLLVHPDHIERARAVLGALGYTRIGDELGIDDVAGVQHGETWVTANTTNPAWIDLHWRLPGCDASDAEIWDGMASGFILASLAGGEARIPSLAGLALHVALHAAQHGLSDLKALADLRRAAARWSLEDWRAAADLAERLGASRAFAAGLRLDPAGAALAAALGLTRDAGLEWQISNRHARPRGTFHLGALTTASTWRRRADVVRRSLFPRRDWIRHEFAWASGGRAGVAYAVHLVRAPVWALRAWVYLWKVRGARRRRRTD